MWILRQIKFKKDRLRKRKTKAFWNLKTKPLLVIQLRIQRRLRKYSNNNSIILWTTSFNHNKCLTGIKLPNKKYLNYFLQTRKTSLKRNWKIFRIMITEVIKNYKLKCLNINLLQILKQVTRLKTEHYHNLNSKISAK